jgi:hypothetical protein
MRSTGYSRIGLVIAASLVSVIALFGAPVHGQQKAGDSLDTAAAAEAAALRDVDVKMTHPDPDMRMGYLQAFVAEGNARKIERAIRIALAGQDENLRALGFRAYLAATGSVIFDILVSPQERKQVEDSRTDRRHSLPRYLENSSRVNYSVKLDFEPAPINSMRGFVKAGGRQPLEYTMRGERLTFGGLTLFGGANAQCNWELKPTRDLKILASLACQSWERPMQLTASMF